MLLVFVVCRSGLIVPPSADGLKFCKCRFAVSLEAFPGVGFGFIAT